jgi:hypothetical protein
MSFEQSFPSILHVKYVYLDKIYFVKKVLIVIAWQGPYEMCQVLDSLTGILQNYKVSYHAKLCDMIIEFHGFLLIHCRFFIHVILFL